MKKKTTSLALKIAIGLILGIILGLLCMKDPGYTFLSTYISPIGTIYLNLLKFVVVPIVLLSMVCGITSMKDLKKVWSVGWKTLVFYLATTCCAIVIGLIVASLARGFFPILSTSGLEYKAQESKHFMQVLVDVFPSNIITPLSSANMLQVIVLSILVGLGILAAGPKANAFNDVIISANEAFMKIIEAIISLSPYGVFCLIAPVVAQNGPKVIGSLALIILIAYVSYFIHLIAVYSALVGGIAHIKPSKFFTEMAPAMMMAFSSASSVGTLPLNMECTNRLGARKDITSFVLPLGATINMDGTAIYHGVCTIFIAACFGINLTFQQLAIVVVTATLSSIGTAGVPGAGVVMLAMVLQAVGLPVEGIALVLGVDRIFDMGRTTLNITGDAVCALCITKIEQDIDK